MINYSIIQTEPAIIDIISMVSYISETLKNPDASARFTENINQEINKLSNLPFRFREVAKDKQSRSIRLKPYMSYNIFYTVNIDKMEITILRVLKDKQDWKLVFKR